MTSGLVRLSKYHMAKLKALFPGYSYGGCLSALYRKMDDLEDENRILKAYYKPSEQLLRDLHNKYDVVLIQKRNQLEKDQGIRE